MTEAAQRERDLVVLGAGPAGLAAAWYAARRGLTVAVVDRAAHVGGLAASVAVDGQSADLGSHRLHPSIDAELLADLVEVLRVDLQWRPRNGRIRMAGRWLAFPLRPLDLLRNASSTFAIGTVRDAMAAPLRKLLGRRAGDTFAAQVRLHLGPTIAREFYGPYAQKLWAVDGEQLSGELFRRRVSARSAAAIVHRMLRRSAPPGFWYPAGGFGAICDALARDIVARGGEVLTGVTISAIDLDGDQACVHLDGEASIVARTVVSTIPSAGLTAVLPVPAAVVEASRAAEFRGALLVYLTVPRAQYTPYDAHYFPETSTPVSRLSEPKNYRTSHADPAERTVLCAEIPATIGDDLWNAADDVLAERVSADLVAQGLPDPAPIAVRVERRTHVYPVYRVGFERHRDVVDEHLGSLPNLAVLGRQALFAHDNTHHALLMGRSVVEALGDDGRIDRSRWEAVRAAFADHVVED